MATSRNSKAKAQREATSSAAAAETKKAAKERGGRGVARKAKASGANKANVAKTAAAEEKKPGDAGRKEEEVDEAPGEPEELSRKDVVQRALRKVQQQLESEEEVKPATIGALEKLLRLDRDILKETEMPQEIRVLWEETDEDPEQDS